MHSKIRTVRHNTPSLDSTTPMLFSNLLLLPNHSAERKHSIAQLDIQQYSIQSTDIISSTAEYSITTANQHDNKNYRTAIW